MSYFLIFFGKNICSVERMQYIEKNIIEEECYDIKQKIFVATSGRK